MFGFLKKTVPPAEFAQGAVYLAQEWLASDAGRALGMRFADFDGSDGCGRFLESKGVSIPKQKLHYRLFTHCALQANFTQYEERLRSAMTLGAMQGFTPLEGYDPGATYDTLEAAYRGQAKFDARIDALTYPEARVWFLPVPFAGVINAKYLLQHFILPHMENPEDFVADFGGYSSPCCAAIGCVQRAVNQIAKSFKIAA